jgi:branched-chain amino acid transport system permease protein
VRRPVTRFLEVTTNGLTLAAFYFLVSVGFSLIFGLLRVVNLAHGALYLTGGYIGFSVNQRTGNFVVAALAAGLCVGVIGLFMHQVLLKRVQGQELREAVVTIAVAVIIGDQLLARYGGQPRAVKPPRWLQGAVDVGGVKIAKYGLMLAALAVVVGALLWWLVKHTRLGIIIRSGIDDREMVGALGINVPLVFALVFVLGSFLIGAVGWFGAPRFTTGPGLDGVRMLDALTVVVIGGLGRMVGAAAGAVIVALAGEYGLVYLTNYAPLITLAVLVIVLATRPQGLLGRKERLA